MEFNEKLQELRKKKGLTQEELASELYVSRTAVSKWELGKGYPSIDTLKSIAKYFSVTVDELLSSNEALTVAENDVKQKERNIQSLIFGLLDVSNFLLLFLPLFGQKTGEEIISVSLLELTEISMWLKITYFSFLIGTAAFGILTLALQNASNMFWQQSKSKISLIINTGSTLLFILSTQPYAAALSLFFLIIKASVLLKKR